MLDVGGRSTVMAFDSTLPLQLEEKEKGNAQSLDCLRFGERKMFAQARFPEADSGSEVNSISWMEHHLRDDQVEIVSFSLVTIWS